MDKYYENVTQHNVKDFNLKNEDVLMSKKDHDFLMGLIEKEKPTKILEIGVYAGGTTVTILNCLQVLELMTTEVYSVDLCKILDTGKRVGYLLDEMRTQLKNYNMHKMYTGVTAAEVVEEIASDAKLDFVIIDTVHYLPGELLDFLCILPFVRDGAIVVLHDVMLNHASGGVERSEATKVLFDVVSGDKIWNWQMGREANIAAIRVNADTRRNITDAISALSLSWHVNPGLKAIDTYRKIIEKYYEKNDIMLFNMMTEYSVEWYDNLYSNIANMMTTIIKTWCRGKRRLWILGYTGMGEFLLKVLSEAGLYNDVCGFLVTDECKNYVSEANGKRVYKFCDISYNSDLDFVLLATENREVVDFINENNICCIKLPPFIIQLLGRWSNPTSLYDAW